MSYGNDPRLKPLDSSLVHLDQLAYKTAFWIEQRRLKPVYTDSDECKRDEELLQSVNQMINTLNAARLWMD